MGVVYSAHDERLNRTVAMKMIHRAGLDTQARERLWREARAAAAVNHPNICQIYEIGEEGGELFIVMELLEGEALAALIERGRMAAEEALQIALGMLNALEALHRQGFVHRDLKPSNVFRTRHGIKLLDFGLAKPIHGFEAGADTATGLTAAGMIVGTPHYMSPEQLTGRPLDARSDVFTTGTILFELLTGRKAFPGQSIIEVFHAITYDQPPALEGSGSSGPVGMIIRRALAKNSDDRYATADAMAEDLRRSVDPMSSAVATTPAPTATRLIVPPFHMLRPDPETEFLAFSLPEAIASSLAGLQSLVVRSSRIGSRFSGPDLDLKRIATETEVDVVLTGTLMRAGDKLRLSTQLVEAPGGAMVWSHTAQATMGDLFQLQDELVQRIVESLSLPLTARERQLLQRDVPASPKAYEYFLRANRMFSVLTNELAVARDLYLRCVEEDPRFAPAWARLGRCYRVLAKYGAEPVENMVRAEEALARAFALSPELPTAHHLAGQLEAERGRAKAAMLRFLSRLKTNRSDPELYAGLVHACRYCGLMEASLAAHRKALELDPTIATSVIHSYFMLGEYQRAIDAGPDNLNLVTSFSLACLGRAEAAAGLLRKIPFDSLPRIGKLMVRGLQTILESNKPACLEVSREALPLFTDPEGVYYFGRMLAYWEENDEALATLRRVADEGFQCGVAFRKDPYLESIRGDTRFTQILEFVDERTREAHQAYLEAGGEALLGPAIGEGA